MRVEYDRGPEKEHGSPVRGFTTVELLVMVAVLALIAAIAVPNFIRGQRTMQANLCIENLRKIDEAKSMWSVWKGKTASAEPSWPDLVPEFLKRTPTCPSKGKYSINDLTERPSCNVEGHVLAE